MGRPPKIPGHPRRKWLVYTTDRTRTYLEAKAAAKDETVGELLDRYFGHPTLGGWNE